MKIALVAHDNKKADMVAFVSKRLNFFNREDISEKSIKYQNQVIK